MTTTLRRNRMLVVGVVAAVLLGLSGLAAAQVLGRDRVLAYDTDRWNVWAPAGESRIVVDGDGDTDLDCYVYSSSGLLLGMDADRTDYCIVDIWQRVSGTVRLEIRNLGGVYNEYIISRR